jgi:branched-chain amino acid transport system substrate-binding protein
MDTRKPALAALGRRTLLGGATLLGAGGLTRPFIGRAHADEPIRIGLLLAKTGDIAPQAEYLANGSFLALAERGNKIMGKPAELVWLDEPSPQGAQQNMQKLAQENKVVAILGGALSSSALAEEATAPGLKVPLLIENAAATDITGKNCNKFTFRLNTPVAVQARMFAPFALTYGKKWYFLTASYAFGQDIKNSFRDLLTKAGGTAVGGDEVPLNTPDYSSFILKIRAAQPDVVLGGIPAGDLSTFLKQWNELGMKGKIPVAEIAIGDTDIWAVGPEAATGIYTSLWWYKNPANPPSEQKFAADYLAKHGKPAADKAWMGWVMTSSLIDSIEAAKSTEPMAIIEALENWKGGTDANPYQYRKSDHQLMLRNLVVQVKDKITDKWDYFDVKSVVPQNVADLDAVFGSPEQVGCHMPPS